ncbi:ABC transporter substrate-binding protein [Muricoccus pecuniae]|uniref:Putative spermidine/putrescine transport system substrate-binding protein n=1 Tax=Muricoccus pecuniae TaxID=693023 RepID=A0A840YAL6_9PROT|nr:ABC transporter substrate-binding protein [Roseomonas pecuniae]MBB5695749.1 putative spermidine/putrescine transport system substrate-binding protein [Roseomonas pecuniae]
MKICVPPPSATLPRRALLAAGASLAGTLAMPGLLRAQTRELVVGGAASHKPWMDATVIPFFERKYNCRITYEGTRSLVNLEKMQTNRSRPYLSVVQMDDPVMILAARENLLERLTPERVPNLNALKPGTIHMDGMWANYLQPWQGIAYNTRALPNGIASWAELWEPRFKGRVVLPSLQNTEGLANLFVAASLETGKPPAEAQADADAGFRKLRALKPNLLTIYTQMPQAFNLLEQGEAWAIAGALSSFALERKAQGAPIALAAPQEGIYASPSGICAVRGGPNQELAMAYVNEMLGAELQAKLAGPTFSLPTNTGLPVPADMPQVPVHSIDWANVAAQRNAWVQRWDREMAL